MAAVVFQYLISPLFAARVLVSFALWCLFPTPCRTFCHCR